MLPGIRVSGPTGLGGRVWTRLTWTRWLPPGTARPASRAGYAPRVFGYKTHGVANPNYDLPLGMVAAAAKRNDSPFLPPLLEGLASGHSWFSLAAGAVVIANWGYDSRRNQVDPNPILCHCTLPTPASSPPHAP